MNKADIEAIRGLVVNQLGLVDKEFALNSTFDDLGADYLDKVELIMYVEDEFNIEISDEDAEMWNTVQDIVDYVETRNK
jgi:acyl carrier protein